MPYTLVTVVTPSEPTGDPPPANPFGRRLPGPFAGLRGIGSHLPRLSEPRGRPLLVLFAVFAYEVARIIGSHARAVKFVRRLMILEGHGTPSAADASGC